MIQILISFYAAITLFLFQTAASYKILVYSLRFGQSHVFFMGRLADILAEAGHQVVFYQPELFDNLRYNGSSRARLLSRPRDFALPEFPNVWDFEGKPEREWKMYEMVGQSLASACYRKLHMKFRELLIQTSYLTLHYCKRFVPKLLIWLSESILIPAPYAAPMYPHALELLGHPISTGYIPVTSNYDGSYWQRVLEFLLKPVSLYAYGRVFEEPVRAAVKAAIGVDFDFNEAFVKSSYAFVNLDEHLDFHQPTSQKIVYVGGVTQGTNQKNVMNVLENSKRGVILVSFGTVARSALLPNETKKIMADTFQQFSQVTFLVKYDDSSDPVFNTVENIITTQWIPQKEVLAHPKIVGFITHGGINSVSESAYHGVPSICLPLFGDQLRNCHMARARGISVLLDRIQMDVLKLKMAIQKLLEDPALSESARTMSKMMRQKPFGPRERVVGHVEHAIRFDVAHVHDLASRQMGVFQYYGLDVYVPIVGMLFVTIAFLKLIFKFFMRVIISLKRKNE